MDGGAPLPTPGDVARRLQRTSSKAPRNVAAAPSPPPRIVINPQETAAELADDAKDLEWIVDQLGMTSLANALQAHFTEGKPSPLATLLGAGTSAAEVIALWRQHLQDREHRGLTVLEMLAFERWFSAHPAAVAAGLPGGMQFDKSLHVCRQHVGIALYEHARELNWRRPFVFTRTLSLAREYLQRVVAEDHLANEHTRSQFLGKAAVATVLISRFENCEEQRLRDAIGLLDESMSLGNPALDAMPYYLEAATRLYDLVGDVTILLDARRKYEQTDADPPRPALCLNLAELWLRLAEAAVSDAARALCLQRVRSSIEQALDANWLEPADRVRCTILSAFTDLLEKALPKWHPKVVIRSMRTPFGLAEHALDTLLTDIDDTRGGLDVVDHLIAALTKLMISSRGEPLSRRVLADLQSAVSVSPIVHTDRRISALREATRIRQGNASPLTDEGSRIRQGDDFIHLAALTNNPRIRKDGIARLLNEAVSDPNSCNPLVILGRDIEENGAIAESEMVDIERRLEHESGYRLWLRAIVRGDETELYRSAAARAIRSPDVRHRHLGGRSNALTVEDHLGISTDTFVFKRTSFRSSQLELRRAEVIEQALARAGLADRYGLVDHITAIEERLPDGAGELRPVMTVRRFARGSSLADIGSETPAVALARLTSTARYLAYIHSIERQTAGPPHGMRKELKTKEIGRWLKVVVDQAGDRSYFQRWWELAGAVPSFPRRDAHAFNWIVTDEERILAVDLEAVGWRPVGYELAQLTDDVPILPCTEDGWSQRLGILNAYGRVLALGGGEVGDDDLLKGYIAGLMARAVRALTEPGGSRVRRLHGQRLLRLIENEASKAHGADLASDFLVLWAHRTGAPAGLAIPDLADSRRRHISKALAFHLRHNPAIPRDSAGWAPVDVLTGQLRADGLRVSSIDVLAVATAIDETRFESSNTHIRAMYGHSVHVDIDYKEPTEQPRLFHATPINAINAIFKNQDGGLRPMTRQWVHLSTDWKKALETGSRKGSSVLMSVTPAPDFETTFHHAGGATWLAGPVSAERLKIIPLYEMFEWTLTNQ
ncbi:RNA 2'-phosphotransferase [Actinoplanes sp. NEAU-A12]|uniref:RNA 2'-phosphotransferase n=1 Tax=Actinoplanes sandaracinus TaxID=3045177 RepID=A0ABT6WWF6_9ACTN|nr:RNA 2'-phosphotransferase [Actinoplanes sandaracinus]MDI6104083.1 RNA 2'-phosphotransferase [Actinoplanes sandaracinus]